VSGMRDVEIKRLALPDLPVQGQGSAEADPTSQPLNDRTIQKIAT
jgi:hypothetical protein